VPARGAQGSRPEQDSSANPPRPILRTLRVVEGDAAGLYYLFVERRLDAVSIEGDRSLLEKLCSTPRRSLSSPSRDLDAGRAL
jgi:hypothetical protein